MKEKRFFPFRQAELFAESGRSNIWEYPDSGLVVKESKPEFPNSYDTVEDVKDRINQIREDLATTRDRAVKWGLKARSFTPVDFVIHADENGAITYSRVQEKIPNLRTLGQEWGAYVTYPSDTLRQLSGLFKMHSHMVTHEGTGFDLVGSTRRKIPLPIKGIRLAFPLFTSGNIGIDDQNNIHIMDYEMHKPDSPDYGMKKKLGIMIEAAGATAASIHLDAILLARKVLGRG